ncbi:MAG TPA: amidase [bacterium]
MKELLILSGSRLAELIRKREISSAEVVDAHIAQIQKVNPVLNAVVRDRFDQSRIEARQADEKTRTIPPEELPPFHGVPCTIKECFSLTGMPNTSGLVMRKNIISQYDATAVMRLKRAGAIPLGVTNVPELCMWMETYNRVYGRTRNPYNPARIVGGSSGGEGAIISAGGSPFGLGSDIGGSIRMPAFFNGIFGHKPTGGTVPNTGQFPIAENEALRYMTTGPLARKAGDLMPLLRILAGPDGEDRGCREFAFGDPLSVRIEELTIIDVEDNGWIKVDADLRNAQQKAVEYLASRGAKIKKTKIENLSKSLDIWISMLSAAGGKSFSSMLGGGKPINIFWELIKLMVNQSSHIFPSITLAIIEKLPKISPGRTKKFVEMGNQLREELVSLIGPKGAMLYPSYPKTAPFHRKPLLMPFHWVYTAIFNVVELPVTQASLGLNKQGIPLGVQIVGIHGNDHVTIALAMELEKAFGGWMPPRIGLLG